MNFKNTLVISDLDGTLIDRNFTVSERNREAIERFKRGGGHFAVATGRSLQAGAQYFAAVAPNNPSVILNGTVIYDFSSQKILWSKPMERESAVECVRLIRERFPDTGIEVYDTTELRVVHSNEYIVKHLTREGIEINDDDITVFGGHPLCKALIADEADVIRDIIAFMGTFEHKDVRFVPSNLNYLEMLPACANKGCALKELISICGFSIDQVYAIGDYYNDVELLAAAGFAVMPENAPDDLKQHADLVVCSCDDGAVADLIEYIEQK